MGQDEARDIGQVLKRLRENRGLSQRALAEQLGVQQPAVARWEAGGVQMPINRLDEVLRFFGYGVSYDLTAVPLSAALDGGVPYQLVRIQPPTSANGKAQRVVSGDHEFAVNPHLPWQIDIWHRESKVRLAGAIAIVSTPVDEIAAHPDGVLVRQGRVIGKVTFNAKGGGTGSGTFTYSPVDDRDIELAGLANSPNWER